jgi:hypothetical protein
MLLNAILLAAMTAAPVAAHAGWTSTWTNTAIKQKGQRAEPQNTSMALSGGRVRLEQPEVITVIDYNSGRIIMMNPTKQHYWSGTVDEYVRDLTTARDEKVKMTYGQHNPVARSKQAKADTYKPPKVDPAKLPAVSVTKTGLTGKVAGYDTEKYDIYADGELFQEIWVAPVDVSSDLNIDTYLALQRKMGAAKLGKSSGAYNALYLNEDYRKLLANATVLKVVTHHLGGGFERVATSMQQDEVPDSQFSVPAEYRRVRLFDVLNAPQQGS